ncbi:diguanylate cyclase domain-containing protein [Lysobacter yangpyeongensis]|uniref:Diguanylate cyclase domain-containing protein n=1 Tax=Lysobacter yangpyeongensis TaxID=346182 RepID=A0ABW0SM16_9GAMM
MDDPAESTEAALRERLARAEARLAQVLDALRALPDGIVLVDRDGRITDLNLGAMHLTGWTEAQALGRPLHEVLALHDSHGRSIDLLAPGRDASGEVASLVRRDRHEVLVDAGIAPILDRAQQPSGAVIAFRNVTAAKRMTDELTFHATHDALTGVLNRRAFESHLQRATEHAARHGTPYALLYLDLDRFKAVNDTAGHVAGDELLRVLSALLQRSLRDHDMLARLGGDEFAVLLEHCEPAEAEEVAERIRAAVEAFRFRWVDREFTVGASIGVVPFRTGGLAPRDVLRLADEMCYRAKAEGRNRVQFHQPDAGPPPRRTRPAQARRKTPSLRH